MHRRIITSLAAIAFALMSTVSLAADNALVVGSWNMELDFQGQPFALDLVISESSEGLAGTMGAPEFGVAPVSKVMFDGETLSFEADDQQGGMVEISLKLADSKLSGNIISPMGDIPAVATRK